MARANRNAAIDGLRALAVWSVFLFHIRPTSLPGGFVGVDVFFVISGYVVCRSLLALPRGSLTQLLTSFYFRRLLRIYPPLLACLITTGVMARMFIPPSSLAGNSDRTGLFAFWGLSNYELAADHDTYFGVMTDFNPYVHTWSLAVEEQFYVVFPLLFFLARQSAGMRNTVTRSIARWLMPAMVLTSLCTSMWQSRFSIDSAFFLLPSRFWELGAGVLLSFLHDTKSLLPRTNRQAFLLAASGLGLIGMSMRFVTNVGFPFPGAIAPVAGSVLLICGVALESSRHPIKQLLEHPICVYFGRISYSLYLWHWPVIVLLRWTYGTESLSAAWFAVSVTTILAMLSYHLIEIPCQWAGRFGGGEFSVSLSLPENDGNQPVFSWFVSSKLILIVIGLGGIFVTQKLFDRVVKSNRLALSVTTRKTAGFNSWRDVDPQFLSRLEPSRRLFIIGDSHAGSYAPMAKMFSQEFGGSKVVIRTLGGANFATLLRRRRAEDQRFVEAALAELRHAANRGDAVLLSSLRVERLCDQWKAFDLREVLQRRDSAAAEEERLAAVEEGVELIAELQAMGLEVIIEAPKPILPSPAFRCRDWFNRSNPIGDGGLAISRSFLLGHRAPAMRSIAEVCRRLPATHVWDPFWVLCPGEVFEGMEGERAIFFDGDHLAPYGNQKLYSSLRDFVLRIWGESRIAGRER